MDLRQYDHKIFCENLPGFDVVAMEVFRFQYDNNTVYRDYVNALGIDPSRVRQIEHIPFLPIRFFKTHSVQTTSFDPPIIFESSGTTGSINSRHLVKEMSLYEHSFTKGFEIAYGPVRDWCIIGLLPSYLERKNSSLVYMVDKLIQQSPHPESGFYLAEFDKLFETLGTLEKRGQQTLLIGVTFALLDFAENYSLPLHHTTIMETGGMKGRREEMVREEVHEVLRKSFGVPFIHSEYGMTELLSQAYSKGNGLFHRPPWMKVLIRDDEDPLSVTSLPLDHSLVHNKAAATRGAINIIDLANLYSCSFIATDDAGQLNPDSSFEVLGRIDNSDIRGCSLMVV